MGEWQGNCTFYVAVLDDFDFNYILGMDFFMMTGSYIMLGYGGLMIMDEVCICFVKDVPMQIDKDK